MNSCYFFKADCPSGNLNPKKFVVLYQAFYPDVDAEKFTGHLFKLFDTGNLMRLN